MSKNLRLIGLAFGCAVLAGGGLQPHSAVAAEPIHECDRLAGHPHDPKRITDGVELKNINAEAAVSACEGALKSQPNNPRFMYEYGRSLEVAKRFGESLMQYRKASDLGYSQANFNIGLMHYAGVGVAKDEAEAVKWFRKAADQGNAIGQSNLGLMYANGKGVAKDEAEAVKWYRKAADQGDAGAQKNLGEMYEGGKGVAKDDKEAINWYRKAADGGNAEAQYKIGRYFYDSKNFAEAKKYFLLSAEQKYAKSVGIVGIFYQNGWGGREDWLEAKKWYIRGAELGDATSQYQLAKSYIEGSKKDYYEAIKWLHKAADQGHDKSKEALNRPDTICYPNDKKCIEAFSDDNKKISASNRDAYCRRYREVMSRPLGQGGCNQTGFGFTGAAALNAFNNCYAQYGFDVDTVAAYCK
ncbi:SEL1-like repeat protein [Magnetospirillum sp. ME-1]|uniref:SEL1-like repeat protein n=1 Tax=Magnetospirillum sp. ME-1 TaxID=1639348 RepID=UPI000A1902DC|nr:tetratricopeptide repeat protein [Magnetospirillum sp. ME-1]